MELDIFPKNAVGTKRMTEQWSVMRETLIPHSGIKAT